MDPVLKKCIHKCKIWIHFLKNQSINGKYGFIFWEMDPFLKKCIHKSKIWIHFLKNRSINGKYGFISWEMDPVSKMYPRIKNERSLAADTHRLTGKPGSGLLAMLQTHLAGRIPFPLQVKYRYSGTCNWDRDTADGLKVGLGRCGRNPNYSCRGTRNPGKVRAQLPRQCDGLQRHPIGRLDLRRDLLEYCAMNFHVVQIQGGCQVS
jgi:hypothetical protein